MQKVPGYKPKVLAVRQVDGIPSARLFRLRLFWFFTLIGMTVPYRLWFARHCDNLRVTIVKETSVDSRTSKRQRLFPASPGSASHRSLPTEAPFRLFMQSASLYSKANLPDNHPEVANLPSAPTSTNEGST